MTSTETNPTPSHSPNSLAIGTLLMLTGGAIAIALAIVATRSPGALWAIILIAWGLDRVRAQSAVSPWVRGLVLGVCYVGVGLVAFYIDDAAPLWAMILVNWFVDRLLD